MTSRDHKIFVHIFMNPHKNLQGSRPHNPRVLIKLQKHFRCPRCCSPGHFSQRGLIYTKPCIQNQTGSTVAVANTCSKKFLPGRASSRPSGEKQHLLKNDCMVSSIKSFADFRFGPLKQYSSYVITTIAKEEINSNSNLQCMHDNSKAQ